MDENEDESEEEMECVCGGTNVFDVMKEFFANFFLCGTVLGCLFLMTRCEEQRYVRNAEAGKVSLSLPESIIDAGR